MGGLNGRLSRLEDILEGAVGTPEEREAEKQLHRERAEQLLRNLQRAREKAQAEAAAGNDRRLRALEELEEHMKRRVEDRREHES